MKKFTFLPLTITRLLGIVFLWMNLGHAPDLHAQARKPELDFETLNAAGNNNPRGLWSDATTMWVADEGDRKLYAYVLATQERDAGKDLTISASTRTTNKVHGLWSDATTVWVLYYSILLPGNIYAHNLATGTRDTGKGFVLAAGNTNPSGLWSDGTTMWVVDDVDDKLYAYNLANKTADAGKDFTLAAGNDDPRGLWSNGITMWVADDDDDKLYAYNLANKTADAGKDFTLATGNDEARDLWSDGTTMWVINNMPAGVPTNKVYAYVLPKESQTIENFTSSLSGTVDDTLDLSATASSGLEVTYSSSDPSIAEVGTGTEEGKLILKAGGDAMITASQVGNTEYFAVAVTQSITVSKKPQTIENFTSSLSGTAGDTLDLSATASSTLEVTYVSSDPSIAEVGMGTEEGKLILKAGGDAMITASQVGNTEYLVATEVSQSITVSKKDQTITFTLSAGMLDDTLDLSATASSMLEVTYVSSDPSIAAVGMGTEEGKLILKALGNATITASQAGDAQYLAAPDVTHTITVNKKDQTITFTLSSTGMAGDTLDLSATASSTLEVTYVSSDPSIAEVGTGTEEGKLILKAAGNATITASQAGNDRYLAAPDVTHTITVNKKDQTITFTFSEGVLGDTLDLSDIATASSMLEVTYVSSNSDIAEVGTGMNAGKLILKALGNATITASQAGNDRYLEAPDVTQDITVSKKSQTITFALSVADTLVGDISALSATSSSGLEVSYVSSDPSIAEVGTGMNAGKLILKALGNATITASQIGNEQYDAAIDVSKTIRVAMMSELELVPVPIQIWPVGLESTLRLEVFGTLSTHPRMTWSGLVFPFPSKAYPPNNTGIFSHTPEMQGSKILTFLFGIRATEDIPEPPDAVVHEEGKAKFKDIFFIFVNPVKITPAPVDLGVNVNTPMSSVVLPTATGGNNTAPAAAHVDLVYTLTGLPDGLSFDPVTWTLSGTPTLEGVFELTYKVFDPAMNGGSDGNTDTKTFNIVVHSTTDVIELPSAVTDLTAIASHEEIILSWSEPMLNGSTIIGYDITYGETTFEVASQQTSTTISGLTNGQEYSFIIVAKSAIGNSASSAPATGTPVVGSPLQITGLSATAGNEEVTLTWLAPANDGGSPITDYKLSRDGNSPVSLSTILLTDTVTGLMNDQEYTFTISATNTHGDSESSAPVTATPVDKNSQMITFTLLSSMGLVGDTLALSATSSSGLEVSYVSSKPSVAEVNADKLILKAGGSAIITANQAGDAQYFASTSVTQDISVNKKTQTITFTLSGTGVVGDTLDLSATASSGLEVSYSSSISNTTIAEVGTGINAGKLILKTLGSVTITASQVGNPQYLAAPAVSHTITVNKKDQTITFTFSEGVVGDTLDLSDIATVSSMLEVSYVSSDSDIAEVGTGMEEGKLILKAAGNATITASQAGNDRYLAAPDVTHTIIVSEKALSVDVKNTDIRVWPNPVATQLNISSGSRGKLSVTLRNLTGQRLQERELEGEGQMDLALVPAGVYLLHIRTAKETTSYLIYKE